MGLIPPDVPFAELRWLGQERIMDAAWTQVHYLNMSSATAVAEGADDEWAGCERKFVAVATASALTCGLMLKSRTEEMLHRGPLTYVGAKVRRWIGKLSIRKVPEAEKLRAAARKLTIGAPVPGEGVNHGHPHIAGVRRRVLTDLDEWRKSNNITLFDTSSDSRTRRLGWPGVRDAHWLTDVLAGDPGDVPNVKDWGFFQDSVNYIRNLADYGARNFVLSSFVPSKLAYADAERSYWHTAPTCVVTRVAGGARYEEEVFDFSYDRILLAPSNWWTAVLTGKYGWIVSLTTIPVPGDTERQVVVGVVEAIVKVPLWFVRRVICDIEIPHGLQRPRNVCQEGGYLLMRTRVDGVDWVSVKSATSTIPKSVEVRADVLERWKELQLRSDEGLYKASVATLFREYKGYVEKDPFLLDMLCGYLNVKAVPEFVALNYTPVRHDGAHECVAKARLAAAPLIEPGGAPTFGREADEQCVAMRIDAVANLQADVPKDVKAALRLVPRLLVWKPGQLVAKSIDRVIADARTENQRRKWQRAATLVDPDYQPFRVKPFQKREAYEKQGADPRNISDCPAGHAVGLGCYTAPLLDSFMTSKHILVGCNSTAVGWRLREMCELDEIESGRKYTFEEINKLPWVVFGDDGAFRMSGQWWQTDFTRLDGSLPQVIRDVFDACVKRGYSAEEATACCALLAREVDNSVVTGSGVEYNSGSSVLSGSKNTTLLGTTANVCVFVVALFLGIPLPEAASLLGMTLKLEPCDGVSVTILSRTYPNPAESIASHACVLRLLRKAVIVYKGQELSDKVYGYLATEAHVPLVSTWLRTVARVYKLRAPGTSPRAVAAMWERDRDMAYRLSEAATPLKLRADEREMLVASVAHELGISPEDLQLLTTKLSKVDSIAGLQRCMLDHVPAAACPEGVDRE